MNDHHARDLGGEAPRLMGGKLVGRDEDGFAYDIAAQIKRYSGAMGSRTERRRLSRALRIPAGLGDSDRNARARLIVRARKARRAAAKLGVEVPEWARKRPGLDRG